MFYEELDALFAFAIGALLGVSVSIVLCIIFVLIPDTGMTARNFAWVLLSSLGTAFASGFLILWMSRRTVLEVGANDNTDGHGNAAVSETDGRLDAAGRRG